MEDRSRERGRADHHPGSRDRRTDYGLLRARLAALGGGVNKNNTPRRTPPRVGPVPGEGFRGTAYSSRFHVLGAGLLASQDPAQILFEQRQKVLVAERPAGTLMRRRAFNSSSLMALVNRRRQLGAICKSGATCTRALSRPLR